MLALLLALGVAAGACGPGAPRQDLASGAALFQRFCASCHGSDGLALPAEAPPLQGSSWVTGPETRLIRIVMHGVRGPIRVGDTIHDREMPGFGPILSDVEIAAVISFVRGRWNGPTEAITPESVGRVRAAAADRTRYWTVEELLAVP